MTAKTFGWYRGYMPDGEPVDEFVLGADRPSDWPEGNGIRLCRATAEQAGKVDGESGWMLDGDLIYKLSGGIVPCNTHEIRVTQWDGSRALADCDAAAAVLFQQLAKPTQPAATQQPVAYVGDMRTSAGMEYYVCIEVGGRRLTPQRYTDRWKAEFDVAEWQALFTGSPRPDILAYGPENETTELAAPVSPSREVEALRELVEIIDAAGLLNLSNGVQLGPTVWYVKAYERLEAARAALAPVQEKAP